MLWTAALYIGDEEAGAVAEVLLIAPVIDGEDIDIPIPLIAIPI
jgi:hypothetical protein